MKNKLKILPMVAVAAMVLLTGCAKVWEEECTECRPLPETEIPVEPDPWEPGGTDERPVGE